MQVISSNSTYASGSKRLLAAIVDMLLLHVVFSFIFFRFWGSPFNWDLNALDLGPFHLAYRYFGYNILEAILTLLYFSYMESSKYQATFGKLALGIKVVDVHGSALEFPKALLRNLSKYVSMFILYIGYIMIIFDDRKQGLHDKIADTFVVNE